MPDSIVHTLLWGVLSFTNMMDPDNNGSSAHLAYREVFDGVPYPQSLLSLR